MFKLAPFLIYTFAFLCLRQVETVEEVETNWFRKEIFFCDPFPRQNCGTNIGKGTCLDADGEKFDACFKFSWGHGFYKSDCRETAELESLAVGWQYGIVKGVPRVCVIFFDDADVGDYVDAYCPSGFSRFEFSGRLGTGFPNRTGDGRADCFSCKSTFD